MRIPLYASILLFPLLSLAAPVPPGPALAIQAAIDALPEEGGRVELAAGRYVVSRPIVIDRDNVELVGQGAATELYLADKANCPVIVLGPTNTPVRKARAHLRVADLRIDGNKDGQKWECWGGACDEGGVSVIRNNGITLRGVVDTTVERVVAVRCRSSGLCAEKGCRRLTISDFTASEAFFDGLSAYQTEDSIFTRLHAHRNKSAGLSFDIHFNHNLVSDVLLTDNGSQGLFMRDSRNNLFQGFVARGNGEQGVFLAQVEFQPEWAATGNVFNGVVISGSRGAGFRLNDATCVNNALFGAQFFDNAGGNISEILPGLLRREGVIER